MELPGFCCSLVTDFFAYLLWSCAMHTLPIRVWLSLAGILVLAIAMTGIELAREPDEKLHFYALDVGQGDALFIQTPSGKQILMDGGPDLSALRALGSVMPFLDRTIDLVILSHPHLDHLASLPEILRRYHVKSVLLPGMQYPGVTYQELLAEIAKQKIPLILPDPTKDLDMGDGVVLDVLYPKPIYLGKKADDNDVNNTSVALRVLYKDQSILLTGDMEEPEEQMILKSGADVSSTVIKIAHHGSKTSSGTGFLLEVHPTNSVISAGRGNKFHHPNQSTLERLKYLKIPTHVTAKEGTIALSF